MNLKNNLCGWLDNNRAYLRLMDMPAYVALEAQKRGWPEIELKFEPINVIASGEFAGYSLLEGRDGEIFYEIELMPSSGDRKLVTYQKGLLFFKDRAIPEAEKRGIATHPGKDGVIRKIEQIDSFLGA